MPPNSQLLPPRSGYGLFMLDRSHLYGCGLPAPLAREPLVSCRRRGAHSANDQARIGYARGPLFCLVARPSHNRERRRRGAAGHGRMERRRSPTQESGPDMDDQANLQHAASATACWKTESLDRATRVSPIGIGPKSLSRTPPHGSFSRRRSSAAPHRLSTSQALARGRRRLGLAWPSMQAASQQPAKRMKGTDAASSPLRGICGKARYENSTEPAKRHSRIIRVARRHHERPTTAAVDGWCIHRLSVREVHSGPRGAQATARLIIRACFPNSANGSAA